jgi:chitinase
MKAHLPLATARAAAAVLVLSLVLQGLAEAKAPTSSTVDPLAPAADAAPATLVTPAVLVTRAASAVRVTRAASPAPAAPAASAATGVSREVLGFFHPGDLGYMLRQADFSALSAVAYFGISSRPSGRLKKTDHGAVLDYRWKAWISPRMDRVIARAHAAGTRVLLTVARFGWTSSTYASSLKLLSNPTARNRLAHQIAREVVRRGVDGVVLDFEPIPIAVKHQFVTFVHQVRMALDAKRSGYDLTVAATGYIANYDAGGIVKAGADAIFMMAYQYHGSWSSATGNISPLRRPGYDLRDTIDTFEAAGAPANKLILGLPYYGYEWSTVDGTVHADTRPAGRTYGFPFSVLYRTAVGIAATHGRRWDPVEQSPWVRWRFRACSSCPVTWRQLYYDDVQSYGLKFDLVNQRSLRGVGIWALGYEGTHLELDHLLKKKFR